MLKKNSGFTLLECLVALIILSGTLLVFVGLLQHVKQTEKILSNEDGRAFQVFLIQFEQELAKMEIHSVTNNQIIGEEEGKKVVISQNKQRIVKSKNNGYIILLSEVTAFSCQQKERLYFEITFKNGKKAKSSLLASRGRTVVSPVDAFFV